VKENEELHPFLLDERSQFHYCSIVCKELAWDSHHSILFSDIKKKEKFYESVKLVPNKDIYHLMIRIYSQILKRIRSQKFSKMEALEPYLNLMDFVFQDIKEAPIVDNIYQQFQLIKEILYDEDLDDPELFSYNFFFHLYCKANLNYFNVFSKSPVIQHLESLLSFPSSEENLVTEWMNLNVNRVKLLGNGSGIFLISALMNHHCNPNIDPYYKSDNICHWIAKRDIKKDEELTITYTDLTQSHEERQNFLENKHFFKCGCKEDCAKHIHSI